MRKILILAFSLVLIIATFGLVSCKTESTPSGDDHEQNPPQNPPTDNKTITGVTFEDATYTYNGTEFELVVEGTIPTGVSVSYTNNKGTNAGTYNATATLTGDGYDTLNLSAKLTINKANITGVTFTNKTYDYNGTQRELLIEGQKPNGVTVNYTNNKGTNAGTYNATATLSGDNYNTLTLNAKLIINKIDITGVTFTGKTYDYYGTQRELLITGQKPDGVTVSYTNNKGTNAGTYNATATLTGANYNTLNLSAKLIINKIEFTGLTFKNETFDYDGTEKFIEVTGILPPNTNVVYTCEENTDVTNAATESGTYTITATITNANYVTKTLTAVMKIQGSEDERFILSYNDNIFFANALHNDYLYVYDGTTVKRISSDVPYNFNIFNGEVYYRSKSLFGNAIKYVSESVSGSSVTYKVTPAASVKGEYLVNDGTYFYYAVNGLTQSGSGIYKIDTSASEPTPVKIYEGKAKYLQYYNGAIYFADGQNDYKLTKLTLSNNTKSLVRDVKINTLTYANGYLFYTVNNTLGDYIENYNISTNIYKKLTIDAGANLTLVGNTLYYVNIDILTSYVNGDGIYYVNAFPAIDMNVTGTKLVGDDTFSSLTKIDDNNIAYYRVSDQMLIIHNVDNDETTEVLDGFEIPESIVFSTGSKVYAYNGLIYFMDLHNDKCLYTYNPQTNKYNKLTSNKVTDFAICGDYLYYNCVSFLVNNDLYKINLKLGGEPEKISPFDCVDVVFDGDKIFYVEQNASGARTAIRQINANGEDIMVYSKGVNNLRVYEGYLYFEDGKKIYKMPTTNYVEDQATLVYDDKNVGVFEIVNDVIYFREVGLIKKYLSTVNIDGTNYKQIKEIDPIYMTLSNNCIYFYSDTVSNELAGIFKIQVGSTTVTKILERTVDSVTYYPATITVYNGDVYFINYALAGVGGDSHLYKINETTKVITKITK